ncbi:MAG: energy transducer TonB [bacterium]
MEAKKSKKADLERRKGMFLEIGLVVALSIILVAFEWTKGESKDIDEDVVAEIQFEDEMMQITRREEPKPEPKPEQPKVAEVLDIVDDDVEIEDDFDFDMEATDNTEYDFTSMIGEDEEEIEEEEVFYIVEDMPTFNGGDPATEFRKYIAQNLRYPEMNKTGQVVDAVVVRSIDPALDKEAIRVVMSSPKWTPGKQRGKAVKVLFTFPINFVLQ